MRLTCIHIAQFRKFHEAIEIRDLEPGLNLFTGPNEAGKSTIASAIRAAFFERHRSSAVEDFRPFSDRQATPAITLEFTAAGTDYRLFKQFLGRARCTLTFGTQRLDGEEAEDHLAKLLGYQYASRGRSKADYWGIPGLLWTEQGRTQELDTAITHAIAHLRAALGATTDGHTEEAGHLVGLVAQERNALLTANQGAPRGVYAAALKQVQQLEAAHQALAQETAHYRQAVDHLSELQAAHRADAAEQPWHAIQQQQHAAQQQLDEVQQWQQRVQDALQRQQQLRESAALFQNQLQHLTEQTQTLAQRRAAVHDAQQAWQQAQTEAAYWQQHYDAAHAAFAQAQQVLEQCRWRDQRASLQQQHHALTQQHNDLQNRLQQADAAHQALQALQLQLAGLHVGDKDLAALRKLTRERDALRIRQQAHATRLQFMLEPDANVRLDGQALHGSGERQLTDAATLQLPGVGTLRIQPGGEGLDSLRQTWTELETAWTALLRTLHAPSLEAVETRHLQATALRAECAQHEQVLRLHAPDGTDALRRTIATLNAQLAELDQQLNKQLNQAQPFTPHQTQPTQADPQQAAQAQTALFDVPTTNAASTPSSIDAVIAPLASINTAQAQADYHAAQASANATRERRHQAQLAVGAAQAHHEHATREWQAAQAALDDGQHQARTQEYQRRLVDVNAELAQNQAQVIGLQEKIAQTRADILAQDVARYRRSAEQLQHAHQQRHETLLRLDAELHTLGARGLDERLAALDLELAQARRRADELARRAHALDHLLQLLRTHQRSATQALQQPLQTHIRHYLDLLFPGAQLGLDEALTPSTLQRADAHGQRLELLDALSHGAREQLGMIGRLACADLLRSAGRPTLLILDDALVHTDAARRTQLKRILFDAATRHQILLFSCHDTWWRDLGIAQRDVGALTLVAAS